MYAQKSGAGRGREHVPYASLMQYRAASECECEREIPVMAGMPTRPQTPTCLENYPLAMVYAPRQAFEKLYDRDLWVDKGTIFTALDFPFKGSRKGR